MMKTRLAILLSGILLTTATYSQKDYSKWITKVDIGGNSVQVLRVPLDIIEGDFFKMSVFGAQDQLDRQQGFYKTGRQVEFGARGQLSSSVYSIHKEDSTFPVHYYQEELKALYDWSDKAQKQLIETMNAQSKAYDDSVRTIQLKEGYTWINTDSVWVFSKPDNKAPKIGKIYRLSYVHGYEVDGKADWVEIQFGDHAGYIMETNLAYEWEDMSLSDEELADLKSGRYYHFEPTGAYKAKLDKEAADEERQLKAMNTAPRRQYFTGPRGGCYYLDAKGNRRYVDHGFCR